MPGTLSGGTVNPATRERTMLASVQGNDCSYCLPAQQSGTPGRRHARGHHLTAGVIGRHRLLATVNYGRNPTR